MPKQRRPENKGLPKRWRYEYGAYYYRVPPGQEKQWDGKQSFRLGATLHEAHRMFGERAERLEGEIKTIAQLLDRYTQEIIPLKAPKTAAEQQRYAKKLRAVFGDMPPGAIEPHHIYKYYDRSTAKVQAKRELSMFSHVYTKAVEWGLLNRHPLKGQVRLPGEAPRTRYVEDWEIVECLSLPSTTRQWTTRVVQAYIRLKILTGMARSDLLRLTVAQLKEDGIHITRHKTRGKKGSRATVYVWSDELRAVTEQVLATRPVDLAPYLFCTRRGESYMNEETGVPSGWASMWKRFMKRALTETRLEERFTEHDLRAKCASDASSLDHARALLSHATSETTSKVYRRKPERVEPLK